MENKNKQIEQAEQSLQVLISDMEKASKEGKRIDKVEGEILESVLQLGKKMVSLYIENVKSKTEHTLSVYKEQGCQNKGQMHRSYYSIFGEIDYVRSKYHDSKKKE